MKTKMIRNLAIIGLIGFSAFLWTQASAVAAGESGAEGKDPWMTDFAAAQTLAGERDQLMLVKFTGSDWCYPCKLLDKEVFHQEAFIDYAEENLVLVKLDFPRDRSKIDEATREQNIRLQREYGIEGYPTVLILDASGTVVQREVGHQAGGAEKYVSGLKNVISSRN